MRRNLTFANFTSLLALFVALGGTSYAVATGSIDSREIRDNSVRSKDVRNGSLTSRDVKRGSLGGRAVRESQLGKVPRARSADLVGGVPAEQLRVRCPGGTRPNAGTCIEVAPRPAEAYGSAKIACEEHGRRLPTHQELVGVVDSDLPLAPGGELTANVYPAPEGKLDVLVVVDNVGGGCAHAEHVCRPQGVPLRSRPVQLRRQDERSRQAPDRIR